MKKTAITLFLLAASIQFALAQPSQSLVISDFKKNGVTSVEGIVINKEWYKDHYLWKASFRTITPVKPEEVDGLKGVTLVRHVVAHYECGGSTCSRSWNGLAYSEYKGINLPAPTNDQLISILKKQMETDPSLMVRSMSGKVSFDSVKIKDPKTEWINPRKMQFQALLYYKEEVSYTEIGVIESPLVVTLTRSSINSPLVFDFGDQYYEQNRELARFKKDAIPPSSTSATASVAGAWKPGDKVLVEENGKWYPATVLQARDNEWYIHYDGYSSQYDLWVGPSRIKNK
jgi:hypothetical protein